MVNKNYY